jgi:Uma2 family endonuclease
MPTFAVQRKVPQKRKHNEIYALEPGAQIDQPTFHARYQAMPSHVKAELIDGVVFMSSPVGKLHSRYQIKLASWLDAYEVATPGVESLDNATHILGDKSEPQPDFCLRIIGGQTRETEDGYIEGAPELVIEVAVSTESIDLNRKRNDYDRHGVREYIVVAARERRVVAYVRRAARLVEQSMRQDAIHKSPQFPGLWLDSYALFRLDSAQMHKTLEQGLSTSVHAAFVKKLARRRK